MSHVALYRRFRPENFDDVVGQEALINTLRGQVMNKRVNHAYLFCGPRGIGKTSVARILAKAINCQNPQNGNFCGECDACKALNNQSNFDIIEIDAASNNGVDNIRDLRENIKFMPAAGSYRVYIIDEVHMLSISAFNALLKTLEEPPSHIVFIMATTEPNKLPITVLSRCQRFDFNRFKASDIVKLLKKVSKEAGIKIEQKAIESIARASEGGARDALSLLDQCSAFTDGEITAEHVSTILGSANRLMYFALAESVLTQDTARALSGFNKMLDDGCNTLSVARDLMGHFRDLFIAKHVKDVANTLSVDDVMASRLTAQANKATEGVLIRCIELFSTLESDLRYAAHPRVYIELAIAKACRSESDNSYTSILERVEKLEKALESGEFTVQAAQADYSIPDKKKDKIEAQEEDFPPFEEPPMEEETGFYGFDDAVPVEQEKQYFPHTDEDVRQMQPVKTKEPVKKEEPVEETQPVKETVEPIEEKIENKPVSLLDGVAKITEKKEETKKNKTSKSSNKNAKALWNKAMETIKKQRKMNIITAMRKAVPQSVDGNILVVLYDANLAGMERLTEKESARMINEALSHATNETMKFRVEQKVLNDEDLRFMEDVKKFPQHLIKK